MNIHDGFIKKANREISKLSSDIEKKKSRIAELRSDIKKHEAEKARDSEFSERVIKLMSDMLMMLMMLIRQRTVFMKKSAPIKRKFIIIRLLPIIRQAIKIRDL